jgi:hypothetical protein
VSFHDVDYIGEDDPAINGQGRLIPEDRAPFNKDEHIRQLEHVNARQAERIDFLTSKGRRMTLDELAAITHVLSTPNHNFGSCPAGTRQLCKHRDAAMSLRAKAKALLDEHERRQRDRKEVGPPPNPVRGPRRQQHSTHHEH